MTSILHRAGHADPAGQRFALKELSLARQNDRLVNAMTVDVEDYYQVQAFAGHIDRSGWENLESRVERNIHRILELFSGAGVKATFFTLGWIGERHGRMVRRIADEGHEIASHGYSHIRVDEHNPEDFRSDIRKTKRILEEAGGVPVRGYRAATFSIGRGNFWAYDILAEEGYAYSSSIYPVQRDNYGMPDAPRVPFYPTGNGGTEEYPITTVRMAGRNFPCGGGGYFRLLPYGLSKWAMRRVNAVDRMPCIFYFHPWEIDTDQPRIGGLSLKSRFRHYINLGRMEGRLRRLLKDFQWHRMDRVFG